MIVIVEYYSDFDMLTVKSVWEGPQINNIPDFGDDREGTEAEKFLKETGFTKIKAKYIACGGNY